MRKTAKDRQSTKSIIKPLYKPCISNTKREAVAKYAVTNHGRTRKMESGIRRSILSVLLKLRKKLTIGWAYNITILTLFLYSGELTISNIP